jgi:hypothetical protein
MNIVGGHERQPRLARELDQTRELRLVIGPVRERRGEVAAVTEDVAIVGEAADDCMRPGTRAS